MSYPSDPRVTDVRGRLTAAYDASAGPSEAAAAKLASSAKLYVRDRISLLVDKGTFVEWSLTPRVVTYSCPLDAQVTTRRAYGRLGA